MFSKEQIDFMKSIGLSLDFDNMNDDDMVQIEDVVSGMLQRSGFDENDRINSTGKMCESILDQL